MQDNPAQGPISLATTFTWFLISWLSLHNAQTIMTLFATIITIGSGILAGRYYWYAAQEKKRALKN